MGLKTTTLTEAPVQYPMVNSDTGSLQDGWLQLVSTLFDEVIALANGFASLTNDFYTITQTGINTYFIQTKEITQSGLIEIETVTVKDGYLTIYTLSNGVATLSTTLAKVENNIISVDLGTATSAIISGTLIEEDS